MITRTRRVIVRLSGSWPHLDQFLGISQAVSRSPARSSPGKRPDPSCRVATDNAA